MEVVFFRLHKLWLNCQILQKKEFSAEDVEAINRKVLFKTIKLHTKADKTVSANVSGHSWTPPNFSLTSLVHTNHANAKSTFSRVTQILHFDAAAAGFFVRPLPLPKPNYQSWQSINREQLENYPQVWTAPPTDVWPN